MNAVTYALLLAVSCPQCSAAPQKPCLSPSGEALNRLHTARQTSAQMAPGAPPAPPPVRPRRPSYHDNHPFH